MIDYLIDSTSDIDTHSLTSTTIALTANELVPIKVQYYDSTGMALISIFWESTSQLKEVIPSTQYYNKLSETPISGTY